MEWLEDDGLENWGGMFGFDLAMFLLGTDNRVLDVRITECGMDVFQLGKIVNGSVGEAQGACSSDRVPRRNKLLALFTLSMLMFENFMVREIGFGHNRAAAFTLQRTGARTARF